MHVFSCFILVLALGWFDALAGKPPGAIPTNVSSDSVLVPVRRFPDFETEDAEALLTHPFDVVLFGGSVFVADAVGNCIKVFSQAGVFQRTIGRRGKGPGELLDPFSLTLDPRSGTLYCESADNRISCFSPNGRFLRSFRTFNPVHDLLYIQDRIVTISYNETTRTQFALYDTLGNLERRFGEFFDARVNKLTPLWRLTLYSRGYLVRHQEQIYVFYMGLPTCLVYDVSGKLRRMLPLRNKDVQKICQRNLEMRNDATVWLQGVDVEPDRFYCYSPPLRSLLVFNHNGILLESMPIKGDLTEKAYSRYNFVEKAGEEYYFTDLDNAQVCVFKAVRRR